MTFVASLSNRSGYQSFCSKTKAILVIETNDIDGVYQGASSAGATVISKPVDWRVPSPDGNSSIHLRTVSLFDPNGIYMEVSDHP
jgi:hypothetical protein